MSTELKARTPNGVGDRRSKRIQHIPEPWVDTATVAVHLGKPQSWIRDNVNGLGCCIPHRKLGKQHRFRLSEIDAWMEASQ